MERWSSTETDGASFYTVDTALLFAFTLPLLSILVNMIL